MASRFYEANTNGMNFDRFLSNFDESTVIRMKRNYWTAKQLLRTKLGKKEDEHLTQSDAELDSKLTLFHSLRDTSENMLACIENYQGYLLDSAQVENELGRYLKDRGKAEARSETTTVMIAVGRAMLFSSHQRAAIRKPLVRFYQELHVFAERAISDCARTCDATERARTHYRGSLLWMQQTSRELDPSSERQLEKFREAQSAVRSNKERLDQLKLDTLQKVDLLSASRSNLLSHLFGAYLELLVSYYQKTAKAYTALADNLQVFQHYEFEILTDLIEPSKKVARQLRQESMDKKRRESVEQREEKEQELIDTQPMPQNDENLLDLSPTAPQAMHRYLFGGQTPPPAEKPQREEEDGEGGEEEEDGEERMDSPLGILEEEENNDRGEMQMVNSMSIGPLPSCSLSSAPVPRLAPPPNAPTRAPPSSSSLLPMQDDLLGEFSDEDAPSTSIPSWQPAGFMDLLSLAQPPQENFPNPFNAGAAATEWDQLLSQCDVQNSTDLL